MPYKMRAKASGKDKFTNYEYCETEEEVSKLFLKFHKRGLIIMELKEIDEIPE